MGVTVAFNFQAWSARYPEFANVPADQAQEFFNEATVYHRNDGGGPVSNANTQTVLLNMATAHIAKIYAPTSTGQPPSDLVGRIATASEGSVSVSAEMNLPPGSAEWWNQTKYGASYWAATAQYRTMRYLRGPIRPTNPFPFR